MLSQLSLRNIAPCSRPFLRGGLRTVSSGFLGFEYPPSDKKRPKPEEIWSVDHTRINGNTTRDGHQSLIGGQHRIEHLEKAAAFLDAARSPDLLFPGVEEIGGGTTVDFPLRYKGENPFDNIRRITSNMQNTPAMCLTRSDSIVGYSTNAKDVVDSFVRLYHAAGIDVFRNFDAYNNVGNHVNISEAVHKVGAHYQGAITFTTHEDPTLYNIKWVRDMARQLAGLGAHSICIKDMSGIASPSMMRAWVTEIREAVPELPLVVHSHYTTGFASITYLEAIRAGATAIDCAISTLSGRTGHPSMEVMAKVLQDEGFEHGLQMDKLAAASDFYRGINPLYKPFEPEMAGSCDYRVFLKGIPGGQISIFKNELEKNQLGHIFDHVMDTIQDCRDEVGGVALVTPTADNVARQQTVNAISEEKGQEPYSSFWSGYNEMLRGDLGQPKQPMNTVLQNKALLEWTTTQFKTMEQEGLISEEAAAALKDSDAIQTLQSFMWDLSLPVQQRIRLHEVETRVHQLESHSEAQKDEVNTQISALNGGNGLGKDITETIQNLKNEASEIKQTQDATAITDEAYLGILTANIDEGVFTDIMSNNPSLKSLFESKQITRQAVSRLIKAAAFITVAPSSIVPDSMPQARLDIERLAKEHGFRLPPESSDAFEEWATLYAIFRNTQDIALNYFKNVQSNMQFWPPCPGTDYIVEEALKKPEPVMYPFMTKNVDSVQTSLTTKWADSQIERITKIELEELTENLEKQHNLRATLKETKSDLRKAMIEEDLGVLTSREAEVRDEVQRRLKRASKNIPHENYAVDVDSSLQFLLSKFEAILQNGNGGRAVQ